MTEEQGREEVYKHVQLIALVNRRIIELNNFGVTAIPESYDEIKEAIRQGKDFPRAETLTINK